MATSSLRFEHVFRDADRDRFQAVEMTRARQSIETALETKEFSRIMDTTASYEKMMNTCIASLHDRSHRTALAHQPCFTWTFEKTFTSPCWYFELMGVLRLRYDHQRAEATRLAQEDLNTSKKTLDLALATAIKAQNIVDKWLWKAPDVPKWCQRVWWDAQKLETEAYRAMAILQHCEGLEETHPEQLLNAACMAEDKATEAASTWPTSTSLAAIEIARVRKAWWKAHVLWEQGEYGNAIGLLSTWKDVAYNKSVWNKPLEWNNVLHDWNRENNTVHYQKVTTLASI